MTKSNSDANGTIEALLQQRAQYEEWLARLEATAEKASASVRERVRNDYQARLRGVIDELRGHAATIAQELEQYRATQTRLDTEREAAEEALAEAQVRHAVGEYGEDEWQRLSEEKQRHLDTLGEKLRSVGGEIARLAEVQALINAPAPGPTPVSVRVAPEPVAPAPKAPPAPEPSPEPAAATPPPAVDDELTFLKSVSDSEVPVEEHQPAAAARRPSNPAAGAATKAAEPAAAPASPTPASTAAGKTASMAKTLKCNECGALNRPTEWYCERCGAELAAL